MNPPLVLDRVTLWAEHKTLINTVTASISAGTVTCVLGPSGSGKTRLLESVAGLVTQWSGEIVLSGKSQSILRPYRRSRLRGLLLPLERHSFPLSVQQRVSLAVGQRRLAGFMSAHDARHRVNHALTVCRLNEQRHVPLNRLNADALRRVDFASLIAQSPPLWLLDEPNNYLVRGSERELLDRIVEHIRTTNAGCLMTLHDTGLAERYADQVLMLTGQGQAIVGPPDRLLNQEALTELTGRPVIDPDRDTAG